MASEYQKALDAALGQVGQGQDASQAIQGVLDTLPVPVAVGVRRRLTLPERQLRIATAIVIRAPGITLDLGGAELYVADDSDGIVIEGSYVTVCGGTIRAEHEPTVKAGTGVRVHGHAAVVDDLVIRNMFKGVAVLTGANYPGSNANAIACARLRIRSCDVGIETRGPDSNGGSFRDIEILGLTKIGVNEASFLGNRYSGVLVEIGNPEALSSYLVEGAANYSTFAGCYHEGGSGDPVMQPRCTVLGGNLVAFVKDGCDRVGIGRSRLTFSGVTPSGETITVAIPQADADSAMFIDSSLEPGQWRLKRIPYLGSQGRWEWRWQGQEPSAFPVILERG